MFRFLSTRARRASAVWLVAATVALGLLWVPSAAQAAQPSSTAARLLRSTNETESYFKTTHKFNKDIHRCLFVTTYGELKYTVKDYTYSTGITYRRYSKFRVGPQQYQLYVRTKCADGNFTKLTKAHLAQDWYHRKCSLNPSIGVSAGSDFEVGVSVTPTCGKVKAAAYDETYEANSSSYSQGTTGEWIKWSTVFVRVLGTDPPTATPCLGGVFKTTAHRGSASGTYTTSRKVCAQH